MKNQTRIVAYALALWLCIATIASAAPIFSDGFESGSLGAPWAASSTNDGRVAVTNEHAPATGTAHLILDDSVNDAVYSTAEATLTLDLRHKKNVVLSFQAKSLGNEANHPPTNNFTTTRAYDGVAISVDGGTTWRTVQSLANVSTTWQPFSVTLDSSVLSLGGSFGSAVQIRFSGYDNAPAPLDGIAIDDVAVTADADQRAVLELPSPLTEGSGVHIGFILLAFAPPEPITLSFFASPGDQLMFPQTVTIPAGSTFASFMFTVNDDSLVNLTRNVTVSATAPDVATAWSMVTIDDDESVTMSLSLPAQVTEGQVPSNNASITIDRPATVPLVATLSANPGNELTYPASVTIPAGQTQVLFTIRAIDDTRIDGDVPVIVTASASGIPSAQAQITAVDNEQRTLTLALPATVLESTADTGTVSIPGTLTTPLVVELASSSEETLIVSSSVIIPAGATSASFTMSALDNSVLDGSRSLTVTATANTFSTALKAVTVRDNDVASYGFTGVTGIMNVSLPMNITVSAIDVEGNIITGFSGNVNLSVVLPDGSTQSVTPQTVTITGSGWTGAVTLPSIATAPLRLRASDAEGRTADSAAFDIMRVVNLTAADLLWDAARSLLYASVPATAVSPNANRVVAINPQTLQVTGSTPVNNNPGQLAMTSGGEFLYVSLNANGTIAKLNGPDLSVAQIFAVGTHSYYGTLYAEDIATVAGQPQLLVVSQYRQSVSPRHNGVFVYENGVRRPTGTQDHTGSNRIEPSADPTLFFGYNNETTEFGFRQLRLSASGMSQTVVNGSLIGGFGSEIISDGNTVISNGGIAVDGANMRRLGSFGTSGLVRPELSANRVYFLESGSSYGTVEKIGAYDPVTFGLIKRLTLPSGIGSAGSFIRWGTNGLAFRAGNAIYLVNSSQLVPSEPPADLAATIQASPNPAATGQQVTYTVTATNNGPNTARSAVLTAVLSDSQTFIDAATTAGTVSRAGSVIIVNVGDLAHGSSVTLTVATSPDSAGTVSCNASVNSSSIDPDYTNNSGSKIVTAGFQSAIDTMNPLRLNANNLVFDASRNLLWATTPSTIDPPLGRSLVSINPLNGLVSDPFPLNASPRGDCIALSSNGRYLYVGVSDAPEVLRVDLSTTPYSTLRVPLGSEYSSALYAQDIEVLAGDGTSFVMTSANHYGAIVYDGVVRRGPSTGIYTADRIEKTAAANVFVTYQNYSSGFELKRWSVESGGLAQQQSVSSLISGYYVDIKASGNNLVSTNGRLIDSATFALRTNFGMSGRAASDAPNARAFFVNGNAVHGFDSTNGNSVGNLALPTTRSGDWAQALVRWGPDGLAVLGNDSKIYIGRWSAVIPPNRDTNGDLISDAWQMAYFGTLNVSAGADSDGDGLANAFEYLFGTSPLSANASPMQVSTTVGDGTRVMHLVFPRRAELVGPCYGFETSTDFQKWAPAQDVVETVLATQLIDGVQVQIIHAAFPAPAPAVGFGRLRWLGP